VWTKAEDRAFFIMFLYNTVDPAGANSLSDGFFVRNIWFSTMLLVIQQPDFFPTGCVLSEPNAPLVAVFGVKAVHQLLESNNPGGILMDNLNQIISDLQSENKRLEGELKRVKGAIAVLRKLNGAGKGSVTTLRPRRQLSVAARKRIAQAQKIRWAKWKAKKAA
jgi:hypothetical protein